MLSLTRGKNALPRTTQIANLSNHVLALATFLNLASCACTTAYLARMPEIPGKQVQAIDRAAKTTSKLQAAIAARDIVTDKHHGNRPPPPVTNQPICTHVLESNLLNHFRPKPDLPYFLLPRDPDLAQNPMVVSCTQSRFGSVGTIDFISVADTSQMFTCLTAEGCLACGTLIFTASVRPNRPSSRAATC